MKIHRHFILPITIVILSVRIRAFSMGDDDNLDISTPLRNAES